MEHPIRYACLTWISIFGVLSIDFSQTFDDLKFMTNVYYYHLSSQIKLCTHSHRHNDNLLSFLLCSQCGSSFKADTTFAELESQKSRWQQKSLSKIYKNNRNEIRQNITRTRKKTMTTTTNKQGHLNYI